jgi:hypothetical protein
MRLILNTAHSMGHIRRKRNDMCENSRKALVPGLLVIMNLANTGAQLFSVQADLNERLMAIERRVGKPGTDLNKLEAEALSLTRQFRSPSDLGKIYFRIAQLYRDSIKPGDMQDILTKIRDYSAKALEYPLDLHDHVRAYIDMGSAAWGLVNETSRDWPRYRPDIASSFLSGLKLLIDNGVPSEPVPLPGVDKIDCGDPQSPVCKAMQEDHDRQLAARRRAEEINKIQLLRATLTDNIVGVYTVDRQAPIEELKEISSQILKDDALVSSLPTKVKAARAR